MIKNSRNIFRFGKVFFSNSNHDFFRNQAARIALLSKDEKLAFSIFLSVLPSSPTFVVDVLKGSLIGGPPDMERTSICISSLIYGNKTDDAIDLYLISRQPKVALQLALSLHNYELAILIANSLVNDDIESSAYSICRIMQASTGLLHAARYLISLKLYSDAIDLLSKDNSCFKSIADLIRLIFL